MGYAECSAEKEADIIVYNTCCVRENAENKVYGNLGYAKLLKQSRPGVVIAVCGCMAQQKSSVEKIKKIYNHVDIICGTFARRRFPSLLKKHISEKKFIEDTDETSSEMPETTCAVTTRIHKHKCGVNIMYGCENYCSYCIVPYVRGNIRCRTQSDVLDEITRLAEDGVKEILLLGQNVNAYDNFAELLKKINEIKSLSRIRFTTSHPKDLNNEIIKSVRDCEKVCKHFHLPVQSGSTRILAQMNRRYGKEEYLSLVQNIYETIPGSAVSTDIIVGFPGETDEDFLDTLDVVNRVGFSNAFTFIYSKRIGTPAADFPQTIPDDVISDRFNKLTSDIYAKQLFRNEARKGSVLRVLSESVKPNAKGLRTGRTDDNILVHFSGGAECGDTVDIKITDAKTFYLTGIKVNGE